MAESVIKVYYFDEVRGRGEFLRMVLTAAGVKFEDVRIKMDSWRNNPDLKKDTPYGQLPYVIYNGKKHGQSIPMASFFAKKYGFFGKTPEDALKQEEVMNLVEDVRIPHVRDWFFDSDADKKAESVKKMTDEVFPRYLAYFEAMLKENGDKGYFVGPSVTMADMYLYDFLETMLGISPNALKTFPLVQKLHSNVQNAPVLKDYLAGRPKSAI
ncbi:hypothetical protein ACOMHN_045637 [Nucella lapillus]